MVGRPVRHGLRRRIQRTFPVVLHRRGTLNSRAPSMQRRHFLRWSSASLVTLSAHPWLSGCRKSPGSPASAVSLDEAVELDFAVTVERARSLGKPVLVFVAPPRGEFPW